MRGQLHGRQRLPTLPLHCGYYHQSGWVGVHQQSGGGASQSIGVSPMGAPGGASGAGMTRCVSAGRSRKRLISAASCRCCACSPSPCTTAPRRRAASLSSLKAAMARTWPLLEPVASQVTRSTKTRSVARREPACPIPRCASAVHGITRRMVRGHRLDYRRIRTMLRQADFVVAHYVEFDRSFVERLMPSSREMKWLCSREDIDWWAKGFESRSLEGLAFGYDIDRKSTRLNS